VEVEVAEAMLRWISTGAVEEVAVGVVAAVAATGTATVGVVVDVTGTAMVGAAVAGIGIAVDAAPAGVGARR
jgi:hypothetical protein